jgi:hypothetical protein
MAVRADLAQRAFVRIVLAVALIAFCWCFAVKFASQVTLFALNLLVFVLELVVGQFMVELGLVQDIQTGIGPLVLGVATATRLWLHLSVKTHVFFDILPGFFVTVQAALVLSLTVKLDVALCAVVLVFRVDARELTRSHDGLDTLSHGAWRQCNQQQKGNHVPGVQGESAKGLASNSNDWHGFFSDFSTRAPRKCGQRC